jgi:hypothetical protein
MFLLMFRTGFRLVFGILAILSLLLVTVLSRSQTAAGPRLPGLPDALVHAPPATGAFAYNSFVPALAHGASYVDPVFGTTVRRITIDHVSDDIYSRNMWWNADETRYLHRTTNGTPWKDYWDVIAVARGEVTHKGIRNGSLAADGGFDPVDPNVLYYLSGSQIHKVTLNPNGTWKDSVYFTTPGGAALKSLGGTLNWFDARGRYMLVRHGPEPSVYLYDRQNLAAGPYANPVRGDISIDKDGYVGITPDGKFLVGHQDVVGQLRPRASVSWAINHAGRSVAASPTVFWSLCGDHGSFISPSDGGNYFITFNCWDAPEVWRADITNNASGLSAAQQKALPNNKRLITLPTWGDNNGHFSAVAKGALKDWAFLSSEYGSDRFNGGTSSWAAYRQEIIAINVTTGEIRRLAHHRSRSLWSDYFSSPRVSASWGGKYVGWASNFNQDGVNDVYVIPFGETTDTISPTVSQTSPTR